MHLSKFPGILEFENILTYSCLLQEDPNSEHLICILVFASGIDEKGPGICLSALSPRSLKFGIVLWSNYEAYKK
jgi:hypothetical protein